MLAHFEMLCLKCVCDVFESIFEKFLRLGERCNDSRLCKNAYKVLTFENISFESVGVFLKDVWFERFVSKIGRASCRERV